MRKELQDKIDSLLGDAETVTAGGGLGLDPGITIIPAPLPMKKWRCSRGHKWESPVRVVGLMFQGFEDIGVQPTDFCMLCLYERAADGLGKVREDT